jgi:NADPH:quinone reductase-like Zn-dependent oxidoreductase
MRALQISAYGGDPLNVLELVDIPEPGVPGEAEVLIDVELAPLNLHDLLFMRGYFGVRRHQLSLETRASVGLQR